MPALLHRVCPFCFADNSSVKRLAISPEAWPLKQCRTCAFVYLEIAAAYEELKTEFAWEKSSALESRRRMEEEPILTRLGRSLEKIRRRYLKTDKLPVLVSKYVADGILVDLGCAEGFVLERLPPRYEKIGIEISTMQARRATELLPKARIIHANAVEGLASLPESSCSGIILSAYLEHETEPRQLLRQVFLALKPEGVAIIKVPNFASLNRIFRGRRWCGLRFPDHVNYFTPRSLREMTVSTGFETVRFRFKDRLPTSDNLWMVIGKPAGISRSQPPEVVRRCSCPA